MRINNNISAVNTLNALSQSDGAMSKSLEKLSSGLRITRASDDAAGLAISEKMRNQVKGLNQARTNAQDGISLIQTAEGALNESHSILSRMRELTVQASNDTLTDDDRNEIQKEMNNMTDEIDRISTDTEFNTKKLLNGNASSAAKKATGMNTSGAAIGNVSANSTAQAGTYQIKFNNSAAAQAMGTITQTSGLEAKLSSAVGAQAATAGTNLGSSLNEAFGTTADGNFTINNKTISIKSTDSVNDLLSKINGSGAGVGAKFNGGKLELYADSDAATNITIQDGTSDFMSSNTKGVNMATTWTSMGATPGTADDTLLTNATAGSVKLTNLQGAGDQDFSLQASDVISIKGQVGGQEKTASFTVGTSTVQDLLTNIGNTFGGATASIEMQMASTPANGGLKNDFNENQKLTDAFKNVTSGTQTININGTDVSVDTSKGATVQDLLNAVNAETSKTGVSAALDRDKGAIVFSSANNLSMSITSSAGSLGSALGITQQGGTPLAAPTYTNKLVIKGQDGASNAVTNLSITATNDQGNTQRSLFNSTMSFTQTQVARDKGDYIGEAQLGSVPKEATQANGVAVKLESTNTSLIQGSSVQIGSKISTSQNARDTATVTVGNTDGSVKLQIGANKGQTTTLSIEDMGATALGLKDAKTGAKVSVMTREDAQNTLTKIDKAISKVSTERSKLGAVQNRLEHTITNLGVSSENMTAAESRIRDLDMASEMSSFTRNQILSQAGTAMMSQANQRTQGVLRLLG